MSAAGLEAQQRAFTSHLRDPAAHASPAGLEPRRLRIYRELVYNSIEGFLAGGFPVLRSLLDDTRWHALAADFIARHRCETPLFPAIGGEFVDFLDDDTLARHGLPAFTRELADYERAEVLVDLAEDGPCAGDPDAPPDFATGQPWLAPAVLPLVYRYPVHRIRADFQPAEPPPQPTCLVVYRDRADAVAFLEANPLTLRLLELLAPGDLAGRAACAQLAAELGRPDDDALTGHGLALIERLYRLGVVAGVIDRAPVC